MNNYNKQYRNINIYSIKELEIKCWGVQLDISVDNIKEKETLRTCK